MEVYGTPFITLVLKQYSYLASSQNLIEVTVCPTTTILAGSQQLVIEFPTKANDGVTILFDNNLGMADYVDGGIIPIDIFRSTPLVNGFMDCRIFFGDATRGLPVKIVCGNFLSSLASATTLKFAFMIYNPSLGSLSQLSIPIMVYSYDTSLFSKTNYNTINGGIYITNTVQTLTPTGNFATLSNQMNTVNDILIFSNANTYQLSIGDSYVLFFNFPLRVNDLITPTGCTSNTGVLYGDLVYHQNLMTIVCTITTNVVPASPAPTAVSMRFNGFYSPYFTLTIPQEKVTGIASYQSLITS